MKLLICFGTRPEYIKVKSLITNLKGCKTVFTGQHTDLIQKVNVDYAIKIRNENKNRLSDITCSILENIHIFNNVTHVLVQGDTTSAMAMALSAFHNNKQVIHLEAGLRTYNPTDPFPEEMNRQIISRIASINFCPTQNNKKNLLLENIDESKVIVTGNTGLDNIDTSNTYYGNTVLITLHRRDNLPILDKWFTELSKIAGKYSDLNFILPLHPNPGVQKHKHLLKNINVIEPVSHDKLITILKGCKYVISDSGGLQEESSYLNKKIIVCRRTTERPESIGHHSIMCPYPKDLMETVRDVNNSYNINLPCPYGDGQAWKKIQSYLEKK